MSFPSVLMRLTSLLKAEEKQVQPGLPVTKLDKQMAGTKWSHLIQGKDVIAMARPSSYTVARRRLVLMMMTVH